MKKRYLYLNIFVPVLFLMVFMVVPSMTTGEEPQDFIGFDAPLDDQFGAVSKLTPLSQRQINPVHMVVVFSKFKDEAPELTEAPEWANSIFDGRPGSVNHYFDEISFGQIQVTGECLPKVYEMPKLSQLYVRRASDYVTDLLRTIDLDKTVDFAQFDNDGPDGIPGSTDDDTYVDFIVLMPISRPPEFIWNYATGIASLLISEPYYTNDQNVDKRIIRLDRYSGCIATAQNQNQVIGLICHEYCHFFGIPDLYDLMYSDEETDSAGIGNWGLMSWGLLGWDGRSGPVGPCAYTRMLLGAVGINNENLIDVYGVHRDIRISDVGLPNGKIYRIWVNSREYFLLEYRRNDSIYCDRQIPKNGMLIWHILDDYTNNNEKIKTCDLECPDGRYLDAGYPIGKTPSPLDGGDNLDFWSHTDWYNSQNAGNLGDATDVFDGVQYTRFGPDTNPNSNSTINNDPTKIEVFNIRREDYEIVFDVNTPPFTDWSKETYPLIGTAFHRFNILGDSGVTAEKPVSLYLVNYGKSRNADVIITVYHDSLTVDRPESPDYFTIQRMVENRIFTEDTGNEGTMIAREPVPLESAEQIVNNYGLSLTDLGGGKSPRWVQKITVGTVSDSQPSVIQLDQNYPNPFNLTTTIPYVLPDSGPVALEVFNVLGQKVLTIDRGFESAGQHIIRLNAGGLSSGVYLYRIQGNTRSHTRKFLYIR